MTMKIPSDAKFGFLVAIGVLAGMAAWAMLAKRIPQLAS
jgi:hypothetical protein